MTQLIVNGLVTGFSYALIALGFQLIYGTSRFFHFAHGATYIAGAYLTYAATIGAGWNPWIGFLFGVLGAGLLGVLMEITVYKPLRHARASPLILLLASLGLFVALQNMISLIFGDDSKVLRSGAAEPGLAFFGARVTPIQIAIIFVSLLLCSALGAALHFSRIGKVVRAVANDPELARAVGIDGDRVILSTFLVGSMLAGIAGILTGYDLGLKPSMGFSALLLGIVAVIVGGVGSIPGAILGGLSLGLVQHLSSLKLPTHWQDAIVFLILLLFLLMRPQGLFGRPLRRVTI